MWPWVRGGDVLVVRRAAARSLRRGDIVLFARQGRLFAHRLLRVKHSGGRGAPVLLTRGDALPNPDEPVTSRELLGRVMAVERDGRRRDLCSLPARVLGRLAARLSVASPVWYPLARAARRLLPRR
jgi:hypothetical protein